jgi:hypothetical protein
LRGRNWYTEYIKFTSANRVREHLDAIYGPSEPPEARSPVALSSLAFAQSETAIRTIAWRGVEVVRAVNDPVRDKDWGAAPTRTISASQDLGASDYRLTRDFETNDASVTGRFERSASSQGRLHRTQGRQRHHLSCDKKALHGVAVEKDESVIAIVSHGEATNAEVPCAGKGRVAILDARTVGAASEDPFRTKNAATELNGTIESPPYAIAFLHLTALEGE